MIEVIITIGLITFVIALVLLIYTVMMYNGLISLQNNITKAWSNIDVLLKQRSEELPNLIRTVKGYMKHEKKVLESLTAARTFMSETQKKGEKAAADAAITKGVKHLFAVAENYPKLMASKNFIALQERISGLENEIADRREFYNDSCTCYNTRIQSFPDLIIARIFGFVQKDLFKATVAEKKKVKVEI